MGCGRHFRATLESAARSPFVEERLSRSHAYVKRAFLYKLNQTTLFPNIHLRVVIQVQGLPDHSETRPLLPATAMHLLYPTRLRSNSRLPKHAKRTPINNHPLSNLKFFNTSAKDDEAYTILMEGSSHKFV